MDELTITTQQAAGIPDEKLYAFWQQSFRQWTDHGIDEPSLHQTLDHYKVDIHDTFVFVAIDNKTDELLGTHTLQPKRKKNYVHGCYLAVSPNVKHQGIATQMFQYEVDYLRQAGYKYIKENTSSAAVWSVNWHLKNGFRIVGYCKSPNKTHSTYIFRKQLKPSLIWSGPLAPISAKTCFYVSYSINMLFRTTTGELNLLGRVAKKIYNIYNKVYKRL